MHSIFSNLVAFFTTIASIWLLRPLAIRIGLVDTPGGRKQHEGHIPLIGGLAMFLGFLFALLTLPIPLTDYRPLLAGCTLLIFIGFLDDFHELSPRARLAAQIAAALLMTAWGNVTIEHLGSIFFSANLSLGNWGLPFTVIGVIAVINAVNMTDGVDGLAGGLCLIEMAFLCFLATHSSQYGIAKILTLMLTTIVAFLLFNFPIPGRKQAITFMGDAGSMFLGFVLIWFLVTLCQGDHPAARPITMLWIIALPFFDIAGVMVRRLQKRTSVMTPGREHMHYVLQDLGLTKTQVTLTMYGGAILCGLIGVLTDLFRISEGVMFFSYLALFVLYVWILHRV